MAEVIHIQRVTIHLKNGTNLAIDLKAEESQQINPQIAAFQGVLADPESQEKGLESEAGMLRRRFRSYAGSKPKLQDKCDCRIGFVVIKHDDSQRCNDQRQRLVERYCFLIS